MMESVKSIKSTTKDVQKKRYKIISYNPYSKIVVYETEKGLIQTNDVKGCEIKNGYITV